MADHLVLALTAGHVGWLGGHLVSQPAVATDGWQVAWLVLLALPAGIGWSLWGGKKPSGWLLSLSLLGLLATELVWLSTPLVPFFSSCLLLSILPRYRDAWLLMAHMAGMLLTLGVLAARGASWGTAHTLYLMTMLAQGGQLIPVTRQDARRFAEQFEMKFFIGAMGESGPVRMDLDVLRAESSTGQRLKHVLQRVRAALIKIRDTTGQVREAANVLAEGSTDLGQRTHGTASGLRDAAMCLEQINLIVQNSAQASAEARAMSSQATTLAECGGAQVAKVIDTMRTIDETAQRITEITSLIDSIAFQTNILALNAAVEAARAGDQGRGFAVVAGEVRALALKSSQAAQEIKGLIAASLQAIQQGRVVVHEAGQTIEDVVVAVRRVGEAFSQLSADSMEHAGGIGVVTQSVMELDHVTQQNLHVAAQSSAIAQELAELAQAFTALLSEFRLGDGADPSPPPARGDVQPAGRVPEVAAPMRTPTPPPPSARAQAVEYF